VNVFMAVLMLATVVACCIGGVLAQHYRDNLLQCLGMGALALWGCGEIVTVIHYGFVRMGPMVLYIGLFLFAVGTYFKVHKFSRMNKLRKGIQ